MYCLENGGGKLFMRITGVAPRRSYPTTTGWAHMEFLPQTT